jgi:prolyl oligopeptidase
MEDAALELLNASDRIPFPSIVGDYVYNFWQDANHTRGIYRRTTIESYRTENPAWELVLDVDALAAAERENWVFKGLEVLAHSNRAMVSLSRGGTDATVYREFDLETKQFVENGFVVPEAKTTLTWLDEDRLIVGTDFGGDSLTDSGYARVLKIWTRGTSLGQAETVFEAERQDVWTYATVLRHEGNSRVVFVRALSFFTAHSFTVIFFRDS